MNQPHRANQYSQFHPALCVYKLLPWLTKSYQVITDYNSRCPAPVLKHSDPRSSLLWVGRVILLRLTFLQICESNMSPSLSSTDSFLFSGGKGRCEVIFLEYIFKT